MSSHHQPSSFFARLPFDIRDIVYTFLVQDDLPPLAAVTPGHLRGFILSCHQAQREVEDLASKRVEKFSRQFLTAFKEATGLDIDLVNDTKSATVTVSHQALENASCCSSSVQWKRTTLAALHPLFEQYFDIVRINISFREIPMIGENLSQYLRSHLDVMMYCLHRDLSYMIARVNRARPPPPGPEQASANPVKLDVIFSEYGDNHAYPDGRVRAKRICISWDLRADPSKASATLNGTAHYGPFVERIGRPRQTSLKYRQREQRDLAMYLNSSPIVVADRSDEHAVSYHIRDLQRLAGEMGFVSSSRWNVDSECWMFGTLLNGVSTENAYCSASGVGGDLTQGLVGISEKAFEAEEREVSDLLYDT